MLLWNYIESWRQKPKGWRQKMSLFLTVLFTLIIILVWLINSWIIETYTNEARLREFQSSTGIISQTIDRIKTGWDILWNKTDNI